MHLAFLTYEGILHRAGYFKRKEINAKDIQAFVATEIGMGAIHKPMLESYFKDSLWLFYTTSFVNVFLMD